MHEIMKILQLIIQQDEIFNHPTGPLYACKEKYINNPSWILESQDEQVIFKGFEILQTVSRRICHFFNDHKIFKHFIFNKREHQLTTL